MIPALIQSTLQLPRRAKQGIAVAIDLLATPLALWTALALRYGDVAFDAGRFWMLFVLVPVISVATFGTFGLYRAVTRYAGNTAIIAVLKGITTAAVALAASAWLIPVPGFPRSAPIIFGMLGVLYVGGTRFLVRWLVHRAATARLTASPVAIYGAGNAGVTLARALLSGGEFQPVVFIDDSRSLQGAEILGIPVVARERLPEQIARHRLQRILLAIPSATHAARRTVLEFLLPFGVHVQTVPAYRDLVLGGQPIDRLLEVDVEDLLGRDEVPADPQLLDACIRGRVVLVTGAGGSIGAELCRRILEQQPRQLLLFDISEFSLYRVDRELRDRVATAGSGVRIEPVLGTACDRSLIEATLRRHGVQTVYHAAAYKHVPLVEANPVQGTLNNVGATLAVVEAAVAAGVEVLVLVSTDKAVRARSIMGATKRVCEMLVMQAARERGLRACVVRFGNVLGSSGSVVPLFRDQIARGGPVTVTDARATRFFMTIAEAAGLVIQAGAMARGGETFVLDMGEPVRILELARRMIALSGCAIEGEAGAAQRGRAIRIEQIGLRSGEKLHEELSFSPVLAATRHAKIRRAVDDERIAPEFATALDALLDAARRQDAQAVRDWLRRITGAVLDADADPAAPGGPARDDSRTAAAG